jgi:hypothetical protein
MRAVRGERVEHARNLASGRGSVNATSVAAVVRKEPAQDEPVTRFGGKAMAVRACCNAGCSAHGKARQA